eukprot:s633_g16.t1
MGRFSVGFHLGVLRDARVTSASCPPSPLRLPPVFAMSMLLQGQSLSTAILRLQSTHCKAREAVEEEEWEEHEEEEEEEEEKEE